MNRWPPLPGFQVCLAVHDRSTLPFLHSPSFLLPHVAGAAASERCGGAGAAAAEAESRNNECAVEEERGEAKPVPYSHTQET